ncbi:MAG: hypothetical protein GY704_12605, partial [Phycisphaeraceae bacterium]|nr:hypothetical protein [Phycisphaeraceae bacterium]
MNTIRIASCVASLLFAATPVVAQYRVWVVDDDPAGGDFTNLQSAVDAAADGDVLLVRQGDYGGFV